MICPKCNNYYTIVVDSRPDPKNHIRRRRECPECLYRFTTYEITANEKAEYEAQIRKANKYETDRICST